MQSARHPIRRVIITAFATACLVALSRFGFADEAKSPASWELRPYQVQVLLALDPATRWPRDFAAELIAAIKQQAATELGGLWQLECAAAPIELRHSMLTDLDAIAAADLPASGRPSGTLPIDKYILVSLSPADPTAPAGYRIAAREFDVATQLWNATVRRTSRNSNGLGSNLFAIIQAAFAPLARIESVAAGQAIVRLRGGTIGGTTGRFSQLADGQVLRPVLVEQPVDDQSTALPRPVAWTWLAPQSTSGSLVKCRIHSGLTGAVLPDYHPQRSRLALAVAPPRRPTILQLVSAGDQPKPLAGCDVYAVRDTLKEHVGRTDRQGHITIEPTADTLRLVSIQYGEQTIARVPLVPGLESELTLSCARDERRLAWETSLVELREDLLDFICRREGLLARNRAGLAANSKLLGKAALDELKNSQNPAAWLSALEKQREQIGKFDSGLRPAMEIELTELRTLLAKHLAGGKAAPVAKVKAPAEATDAQSTPVPPTPAEAGNNATVAP